MHATSYVTYISRKDWHQNFNTGHELQYRSCMEIVSKIYKQRIESGNAYSYYI